MRYSAMLLAAATLSGCGVEGPGPFVTTPSTDAPPLRTMVFGRVYGDEVSSNCLDGASVSVVSGQGAGQTLVQNPNCYTWGDMGFEFKDLTPDIAMTIRFSAPGYVTKDTTVVPWIETPYTGPVTPLLIELTEE
jgi:hypothetical protein